MKKFIQKLKKYGIEHELHSDGTLYVHTQFSVEHAEDISYIPENVVFNCPLFLQHSPIKKLPENIILNRSIDLESSDIECIDSLKNCTINGFLDLDGTKVKSLPTGIKIDGFLCFSGMIPPGTYIKGMLFNKVQRHLNRTIDDYFVSTGLMS